MASSTIVALRRKMNGPYVIDKGPKFGSLNATNWVTTCASRRV